ncbi:(deoxy)nucleoside triphosphate pyrophosphohydrolase [Paenibacillus eucommiae]|uniref:8-oxo-dGTP diphosphatase n=1 Tax=Paenibacillus eucommiae TaxID=1355755 RepID=A0ABS4J7J8_9BACL|nr:(deoxy)nucleoside triphosphate pyrophosphohydrolase [Paenibacillus eucommiae]MBP1995826.1 8-oxo-dGTP diphosphatase [Paenibacillus eucommiae]
MIEVAAAIIENEQGQILIARRKKGKSQEGMWEFPGGKIEQGESVHACLRRELLEEMEIEILPHAFFGMNDHYYGSNHIRLIAHKATYISGVIHLVDHDDFRWVCREELKEFSFAPADIMFVEMLELES